MTDHFALFDETPHPWIEPEALREKFLARSAQVHPDRLHQAPEVDRRAAGERFAQLNTAYNCLRDPKERLRHLLELRLGGRPADVQRIPPGLMDFFFDVGRLCKEVDGYLAERRKVTSPILKAQFIEPTHEWVDKLGKLQQTINSRQEALFAELKDIDRAWKNASFHESPTVNPSPLSLPFQRGEGEESAVADLIPAQSFAPVEGASLPRLEEIYRLLGYFGRWSEQLRERVVQLSL